MHLSHAINLACDDRQHKIASCGLGIHGARSGLTGIQPPAVDPGLSGEPPPFRWLFQATGPGTTAQNAVVPRRAGVAGLHLGGEFAGRKPAGNPKNRPAGWRVPPGPKAGPRVPLDAGAPAAGPGRPPGGIRPLRGRQEVHGRAARGRDGPQRVAAKTPRHSNSRARASSASVL